MQTREHAEAVAASAPELAAILENAVRAANEAAAAVVYMKYDSRLTSETSIMKYDVLSYRDMLSYARDMLSYMIAYMHI